MDLEIDAATIFFPVAEAGGLGTRTAADFLMLCFLRLPRILARDITLLNRLMGHFRVRVGRHNWRLAGRHGGVVCQKPYTRGTARISHVAIGSFGFSE
jgi:hypothetical protein